MSQNRPITLKQVKDNLQDFLNSGNNESAKQYIKILERLGVRLTYTEISEEDRIAGIKIRAKEMLRTKGVPNADSTNMINSITMNDSDQNDVNKYVDRLLGYYESKIRNKE